MAEVQELQLHIMTGHDTGEASLSEIIINVSNQQPTIFQNKSYMWWFRMAIYTLFVVAGQSVATLLGRLYYDKGGNSKWMATLVQAAAFPILLPCYYYINSPPKIPTTTNQEENSPSLLILVLIYLSIGILFAAVCMLYSLGLLNLPVSTYSLICASQLAFNALFSFFLNSQKFTVFIINSLVLLTISSTLLVFQSESSNSTEISKGNKAIGFICTISASAGYSLMLSLTQLAFDKVLKKETFKVILDMIIYPSLVATCAILVGLFASGEWRSLRREMDEFQLGKASYLSTLIWTAIVWQVFSIGSVGLILEVSSLFSNVISTLGLPVVPVLAVIFFRDEMNGIKVTAMVLAIWGFVSYIYQNYLDDRCMSKTTDHEDRSDKASCTEEVNNL